MSIVFVILKSAFQESWCKKYKPEAPCFCCKGAAVVGYIGQNMHKGLRNGFCGICSLSSDLLPNSFCNSIIARSLVKIFILASPVVDKVRSNVFKGKVHKIPWDQSRKIQQVDMTKKGRLTDSLIKTNGLSSCRVGVFHFL